jgi:hypothetical protein
MPTIGSVVLKARQKYGHGLRAAYFRDHVRPKILTTKPIKCEPNGICEIHVLTSANDWLNLVWTLKSFYYYSQRRYALFVHDDGSLDPEAKAALRHHFPGVTIIDRERADREMETVLGGFPRCLHFRRTNLLAPKVFDFIHYLSADRMLLLDSDILFFAAPQELLHRIEDPVYRLNTANTDVGDGYTADPEDLSRACGVALQNRFNSGLGMIHRRSVQLAWIEEFLAVPSILGGHFWRIEQTLYALCSSRFGVALLSDEYTVRLDRGIGGRPCRHYVGQIRHLMFDEGIRHLVKNNFLSLS